MESLINQISELLVDYRKDDSNRLINNGVTKDRIQRWINQFDSADREMLLNELVNIFNKRYVTKQNAIDFLKSAIEFLKNDLGYQTVNDFLDETVFLELQTPQKSQSKLIELLKPILLTDYQYDYNNCGKKNQNNYVYLDDVLCTGNKLFQDIKDWLSNNSNILQKIKSGESRLIFTYIFIHHKNYQKKLAQFRYSIDSDLPNKIKMIRAVEIFEHEILKPIEDTQAQEILDYQNKISELADKHAQDKKFTSTIPSEFYRNRGYPLSEEFFTSSENRIKFENVLLKKGIEIINSVNAKMPNMRALGYNLPGSKDFGFGTLAFSWRSVPNNTPLVFWYETNNFMPLFKRLSTW